MIYSKNWSIHERKKSASIKFIVVLKYHELCITRIEVWYKHYLYLNMAKIKTINHNIIKATLNEMKDELIR